MKKNRKKIIALLTMGLLTTSSVFSYADVIDTSDLDLNKPSITNNVVTLPNATVNGKDMINGMKLYFSTGYTKSKPEISYVLNGKEIVTQQQQIHIKESLTPTQATELIRSIKINRSNENSFQFTVRLNTNDVDSEEIIYNPQNGHHYKFIQANNMKWNESKEQAEKQTYKGVNGYLVTITSSDELDFFNSITPKSVWLGLYDEKTEGKWEWVTGEKFEYTNWAANEPNNNYNSEHYVQSLPGSNGQWNDLPITGSALKPVEGYIVEFPTNGRELSDRTSEEETVTIDRNAPIIENAHNMSILQGDQIDVSKDIVAVDDIDGEVFVEITIRNPKNEYADKVDTNIDGTWTIKYDAQDKSLNRSQEIIDLKVKKKVETIILNHKQENNNVALDWNKVTDGYLYSIFRKVKSEGVFEKIKETNESTFVDSDAIDKTSPDVPKVTLDTSKDFNNKVKKIVVNSNDSKTIYEYKIEAQDINGVKRGQSEITDINVASGIDGYQYKITKDPMVDLSKEKIVNSKEILLDEKDNGSKLHIRAIDKQGNIGKELVYDIEFAKEPESGNSYNNMVVNDLMGKDRYLTAIAISNKGWDKSDNIILVNSKSMADALSSTPFAKSKNAPILLTEKEKLNTETEKEIEKLGAKNIYVIGGKESVSEGVVEKLKSMKLNIQRISGKDRYETSLEVGENLGEIKQ